MITFLKRTVDFAAGVAVGAVAGAAVAYLTAPQSGDELRQSGQDLIDSAVSEGERARIDKEAELRDKFRRQVGNRDALAPDSDALDAGPSVFTPSVPFPS